ncbi:hypothetical protein ACSD7O_07890 [Methylorubrum extorquens]|uniref:hypothetical protein n=1 Tax=Methylorubrum extorquens TaxID=408 RepID=UPI003F5F75E6
MTDISEDLSAVLVSDGSFGELLALAGLDPAHDLKGCDFSFVDFGKLVSQRIDLSHCNLFNADLRKVRGNLILNGAQCAGAKFPSGYDTHISKRRLRLRARFDLIKQAIVQAHRFQPQYQVAEQLRDGLDWDVPIVATYRSPAERHKIQVAIRKELSGFVTDQIDKMHPGSRTSLTARLIEVRSSSAITSTATRSRAVVDAVFFRSLLNSYTEAVVDISTKFGSRDQVVDRTSYGNPLSSNMFSRFGLVGNKNADVQGGRSAFARFIRQQTRNTFTVMFFNNTGLFSSDISREIERERVECYLVFLIDQNAMPEPVRHSKKSDVWPEYTYIKPRVLLNLHDISIFTESFRAFEKAGLFISEETRQELIGFYDRPAGEMKNFFINRLTAILSDRKYDPDKFTVI